MHPHESTLRRLFERLSARDPDGAARCYHEDVFLTNPLFPRLHGGEAREFWGMVFEEIGDFALQLHDVSADGEGGRASWTATYRVGPRHVTTRGRSLFAFREALVCRHYDHFSLWRWSASALGPLGAALGWLGPFRWALRRSLARRLGRHAA